MAIVAEKIVELYNLLHGIIVAHVTQQPYRFYKQNALVIAVRTVVASDSRKNRLALSNHMGEIEVKV